MADDKMKKDDNRNMRQSGGQLGKEGKGQQSPGRNPQDDQSTGQRSGSGNRPQQDEDLDEGQSDRDSDMGHRGMGQRR